MLESRREELRSKLNKLEETSGKLLEVLSARVLAVLADLRDLVDRVLEALKPSWLTHDTLELVRRVKDRVAGVEYVKPGYTCIRDDILKVFTELSRIVELKEELKELRRTIDETVSRIESLAKP